MANVEPSSVDLSALEGLTLEPSVPPTDAVSAAEGSPAETTPQDVEVSRETTPETTPEPAPSDISEPAPEPAQSQDDPPATVVASLDEAVIEERETPIDPAEVVITPPAEVVVTQTAIPAGTITESNDPQVATGCAGSLEPVTMERWSRDTLSYLFRNGLHANRNVTMTNCRVDGWNSDGNRITVGSGVTLTLDRCDIAIGTIEVRSGGNLVTTNCRYYGG